MKSDRFFTAKLALVLLPILLTFGAKGAIAQITPANDGTGTLVNGTQQLNITGGTQAGGNLFHSFQQFGVNAGQTVNFISNPNTQNILGRVTGGNASLINGLLQVSGSNANLYLLNPSGIIFGKNASLNVPGSFTATTANGIGFGNGQWLNAIGPTNYSTLTINPTSFGFIGSSGSLINAGNLSVNPGQSIALVGGTVVNTGTIAAPGGNITIAAIPGEKLVRIGQDGTVLSLDLPMSDRTLINAPITTPLALPELLTGGNIPSAMGVVVEDGVIKLKSGSATIAGNLSADGTGIQKGGNVVAYADNHLNFTGTISAKGGELGGNGGFVDTSGKGSINISPSAKVVTTAAKGLTGNWVIDPADLEVVAGTGGTIDATGLNDQSAAASTIGAGTIVTALNSSNVELKADNSITVNAAIDASGNTNGRNLTLTAPTANLNQAITLKAGSILNGTATTVNVGATGTVQNGTDVAAAGGTVNLAATTTYKNGSQINIAKNITVKGAGAGSTIVSGDKLYRVFNIASGNVTLDSLTITNGNTAVYGTGYAAGNGGGIRNDGYGTLSFISTNILDNSGGGGGGISSQGSINLTNSSVSNNTSNNSWVGGGILSYGGVITLTNSTVSGNTATWNGGGIFTDGGTIILTNSTVSANTAAQGGGGIFGYGGGITLTNSIVSGNTANGSFNGDGGGGGIWSNASVTLTNSNISGNTATYSGGGISTRGSVTLDNSNISNNIAQQNNGGIQAYGNVTLTNSIVSDNQAKTGDGGGFFSGGNAVVTNSTVSGNTAATNGGGILLFGDSLSLTNSTVSGNTAGKNGGGIWNSSGKSGGTITNSTITNNTAKGTDAITGGGGIFRNSGTFTLANSIVAGNIDQGGFNPDLGSNVAGTGFADGGNNLIGKNDGFGATFATGALIGTIANPIDPKLALLGDYGGSTQTQALLPGSPAIDAGNPMITTNDQRGVAPVGIRDVGAYESKGFALTTTNLPQSTTVNTAFAVPLQVHVVETAFNKPLPLLGVTIGFTTSTSIPNATLNNRTATTDAMGKVTILATANTKSGTYTVQATSTGITGTDFTLTNTVDRPSQIKLLSDPETTRSGANFTSTIRTQVVDQFNNPIANQSVLFTLPNAGASGIFSNGNNTITLITDANGIITTSLTTNNIPGNYNGTIQIPSGPTTQFPLSNSETQTEGLYTGKEIPKHSPIVPTSDVLCAVRETSTELSKNDPYKGIPACVTQSSARKTSEPQKIGDNSTDR